MASTAAPAGPYVLRFADTDRSQLKAVGGKGANLGELARIEGIHVPDGFCVTTQAFQRILSGVPTWHDLLDRLSGLKADDREEIRSASADIRHAVEVAAIPGDLVDAITAGLRVLGEDAAYAVRSSATAEDLPTASSAGQQDSYLNVVGHASILRHISRCWASLFTERAVAYRLRNGIDHRQVLMAVVVQRMVVPRVAGVLFTADPVTSNRKVAAIDASFGLGEALVGGLVIPDHYKVRDGQIATRTTGDKKLAVLALPEGGTRQHVVAAALQSQPALTDAQALELVQLGRRIEAHFGWPQDIEWCLQDNGFHFVQSRSITTLFPVPAATDRENHVYVSVGHQQMMTDPLRPLGISLWQLMNPRMQDAGGRLFVDISQALASPSQRASQLAMLERGDPLVRDAIETLLQRGDFIPRVRDRTPQPGRPTSNASQEEVDVSWVAGMIEAYRVSIAAAERDIRTKAGNALLDFISSDIQELRKLQSAPQSTKLIFAGVEAQWWLNDQLKAWLGEKNAADTLTLSVPGNVTTEMGLALMDVADEIRPHRHLVAFLEQAGDDRFLDGLDKLPGGPEAGRAIRRWFELYGMRCIGEIDVTRPRWRERPSLMLPMLLVNIRNFEPGAGRRRFEEGLQRARQKGLEVLDRLRALPDGEHKAMQVKKMIDRARALAGYREYPKYAWMCRWFVYRQALLQEARRLVEAGVIDGVDDIFSLRFEELQDTVRMQKADRELIRERKQAFEWHSALTPPRVLTSEGEAVAGVHRRDDLPAGALVGMGVSAGSVEGRARVVLDAARADLQPGDILVTPFTDPSWTPLFVAIAGLVTEVGGPTTHGAVIAREYGLPAVVGVQGATRLIRDGQLIRVHGGDGFVEILPGPAPMATVP